MSTGRFRGGESRWGRGGESDRGQSRYDDRGERYGQGPEGRRGSEYREPFEQERWGQGQGEWNQGASYGSRGESRGYSQGQADGEPYEQGQGRYGRESRSYGQYGMSQGRGEQGRRWEGDQREGRSYGSGRAEYGGGSPSSRREPSFGSAGSAGYREESWRPSDQFDGYDRSYESGQGQYGSYAPGTSSMRGQGRMSSGYSEGFGGSYGRPGAGFRQGRFTGKGPKGYQRSDDRVKEDVSEALSREGDLDASEVEVIVAQGEVTLEGTVPDRQSKRLAEDVIEDLPGVKEVHNRLRIESGKTGGEKESQSSSGLGKSPSSPGSSKTSGRSSI